MVLVVVIVELLAVVVAILVVVVVAVSVFSKVISSVDDDALKIFTISISSRAKKPTLFSAIERSNRIISYIVNSE